MDWWLVGFTVGGPVIFTITAAISAYHRNCRARAERQRLRVAEAHRRAIEAEAALRQWGATWTNERPMISAVQNWTDDGRCYETQQVYAEPEPLNDAEVDEMLARPRNRAGRWLTQFEFERTQLQVLAVSDRPIVIT